MKKETIYCSITLNGCDDSTTCKTEITKEEYKFLEKLAKKLKKISTYDCMPTLILYKL